MRAARPWDVVALVAGVVGAGLRVRQLLVDRSLWVDEALLVDNVLERGYAELLEPLSGQQGAPVGYLWLLRAVTSVSGVDERWMRLPSLVAGVALLPLVWLLGRRLASPRAAALAVALVAVAPGLVRYSTEVKQYALDAVVAVALVVLAGRVDERRGTAELAVLAGVGAVAAWCSHPAVLVLAGLGVVLLVRPLRARSWRGVARLVPVGALWAASLALLWWVSLRDLTDNEFLTSYWQAGFPEGLWPRELLGWGWSSLVDLLDDLGGFTPAWLAAGAALAGLLALGTGARATHRSGRRAAPRALLLLVPFPALVVAAALEQYPFRGRLALFTLPFLLLAVAGLADADLRPAGERRWRMGALGTAAVVLLGAGPAALAVEEAVEPTPFPDARTVIEALAERRRPGEPIYLHGLADAPFDVYGENLGLEVAGRTSWMPLDRCPASPGPLDDGTGVVWIVFAYTHSAAPSDEASLLRSQLDGRGRRLDLVEGHDAFVARYDLAAPPTDPTGGRTSPATGCLRSTSTVP